MDLPEDPSAKVMKILVYSPSLELATTTNPSASARGQLLLLRFHPGRISQVSATRGTSRQSRYVSTKIRKRTSSRSSHQSTNSLFRRRQYIKKQRQRISHKPNPLRQGGQMGKRNFGALDIFRAIEARKLICYVFSVHRYRPHWLRGLDNPKRDFRPPIYFAVSAYTEDVGAINSP